MSSHQQHISSKWRKYLVWLVLLLSFCVLIWRAYDLQILRQDFLTLQGDARQQRIVKVSAHRGMISDRNGEPLAISTPVDSIWANPSELLNKPENVYTLSQILDLEYRSLHNKLLQNGSREFVYVQRHVSPHHAKKVMELNINGVYSTREYHRYYPSGEVSAHLIGFTDIDDIGQEGIELAFNKWLKGHTGSKRVVKDRLGRVIDNIENIKMAVPGNDLNLSIDKRLQYLAYRELKIAVTKHNAISGSVVILDSRSCEVLAMVNQPAFNPNNRKELISEYYRNRAITDVFEPGSTMKPFTIAVALSSGDYSARSSVNTYPGFMKVGGHTIRDSKNYGVLDMAGIIRNSSNVGASRIALSLQPKLLWETFDKLGFGNTTASGFPGESSGYLSHYNRWGDAEQATLSYGYGIAVTALQLAQAYSVIANDGVLFPVRMLSKKSKSNIRGKRILNANTARLVRQMLIDVVSEEGTGSMAGVAGYSIAGKTGTVHKSVEGGYAEDRYMSLFAGMVPANDPRLIMIVTINEPNGQVHSGGKVAAPVFSKVMGGALRLLNIAPDNLPMIAHVD